MFLILAVPKASNFFQNGNFFILSLFWRTFFATLNSNCIIEINTRHSSNKETKKLV